VAKAAKVEWRKVSPAPVILVFGPEQYFASTAVRKVREALRKQSPDLEIHQLAASDYVTNLIYSIASPSLFSQPRLIVFEGMERCTDAFIEDLKKYIEEPAEDTTLIIRHNGSSVRGKALLEALRANGNTVEVECPATDKEAPLLAFAKAEFAGLGRKVTDGALRALVRAFTEVSELANACEQLVADSAETITEEIVDRYFGGRVETASWSIVDAAIEGRKGEALTLMRHGLNSGLDLIAIITSVSNKMRQLARILGDQGASPAALGLSPWLFGKLRQQLAGWGDDEMARVLIAISDADAAAKGAEKQPEYRLELLISLIADKGRS
jgi:DNA polymerase-3 subunit delta